MIIDFTKPCNVHFIGIGGISMSGLASILHDNGYTVTGSDISNSERVRILKENGIPIVIGHSKDTITDDIDMVVYTVAVKSDNEELAEANKKGIKVVDRATLLGAIMDNYKHSIAVSGTHGKTTTTSMMSHILIDSKANPTILVGGILPIINGNYKVGDNDYMITEACEYYDSFLKFYPEVAIILNMEEDHLDYFGTFENIHKSFVNFSNNIKDNGLLCLDYDLVSSNGFNKNCETITFALEDTRADYYATNIVFSEIGLPSFDVYHNGELLDNFSLSVTGSHNVKNSLSVIAVSLYFGLNCETIKEALKKFTGVGRRFEYKGFKNDIAIVDDYAHHPTEIEATITAARKCTTGRICVVFQPHTFSRTIAFLKDFAKALSLADEIILLDIYSANREVDDHTVHSKDLQQEIINLGKNCFYFEEKNEINNYVLNRFGKNDMLITMGAGDVYKIAHSILME